MTEITGSLNFELDNCSHLCERILLIRKYCRRLNKRLGQLGSTELIPIGLGDDQSKFGYFTELDSWVAKLLPALKRRRKSADITSSMENATSMILKAHYLVTLLPLTTPDASLQSNQLYKQSKYVYDELNVLQSCFTPPENHKNHSSQSLCEDGKCLPIVGYVKGNHRMTHDSWSQDVRHVVISASLSSIDTCVNSSDVTSGTEIFTTTPSDSLAATVDAAFLLRTSHDKLSPGRSSFGRSQVPMAEPSHIAGDVATVYPINDPLLVTRIISILNRSNHEGSVTTVNDREFLTSTMISVKCLSGFVKRKSRINELKRCSIGRLFSSFIDIAGIPQRGFFEGLALHTGNIDEKEKLLEIASAEGTDLYYDYCLKEKRNYIEVLEDFRTANPSLSQLLEMIPVLQPRHYSIANSGLVERGEIHLCVAIASAKTPYGRERTGICSGYLSSLVQGDQVLLWVRSGALKLPLLPSYLFKSEALDNSFTSISNDASHVVSVQSAEGLEKRIDIISHDDAHIPKMILIGPGTGIAPMRALIRERKVAYQRIHQMNLKANIYTQVSSVKTLLFFGCRNREKDFLYSEEWKGLKSSLSSRKTDVAVKDISAQDPDMFEGSSESVVVAFSRDQTKKVYVTDKIKLYGHLVWSLIEEVRHFL